MSLVKTMRWFGPDDPISLDDIAQIGVQGVVSALHQIPNGAVWPQKAIEERMDMIVSHGLEWKVVESVPVHESIKIGATDREEKIEAYCETVRNLGEFGIDIVTYNFMTVVDWVRTDLKHRLPNGRRTMYLSQTDLAVFDIYILQRPAAEKDYSPALLQRACQRYRSMSKQDADTLIDTIAVESQNFIDGVLAGSGRDPLETFREYISRYACISKQRLRSNAKHFLDSIIPVAESVGVRLAIHPDDPAVKVFGLERIASSKEDFEWLMSANRSYANSIALCTGSLSSCRTNDVVDIVESFADRIHFVHLRNTQMDTEGNFWESEHLDGIVDMAAVMRILVDEQRRRGNDGEVRAAKIYLRPDHGQMLLDDFKRRSNPGYPLIGRLKALAELTGLEKGIEHMSTLTR